MIDPNLVIGAGKEVAWLIRDIIKERKHNEFKQLAQFIQKVEDEKVHPLRDHDDLLKWTKSQKLFGKTITEELAKWKS